MKPAALEDGRERNDNAPEVVQQTEITQSMRSLTPLVPDYIDLFTVASPKATDHSAEHWARVALEGASPAGRFVAWQVFCGLRLETEPSPERVVGWKIGDRADDWIRLEAASWFMTAHVIAKVEQESLSIGLFIRYDRPVGALIWTPISALHRRLMPGLLRHADRLMNRDQ